MTTNENREIGNRVRRLRQQAGFAQQTDLADHIGVRGQTIYRIEAGRTKPGPDTLTALAKALRTTEAHIMFGDDAPLADDLAAEAPESFLAFLETPEAGAAPRQLLSDLRSLARHRYRYGPPTVETWKRMMFALQANQATPPEDITPPKSSAATTRRPKRKPKQR